MVPPASSRRRGKQGEEALCHPDLSRYTSPCGTLGLVAIMPSWPPNWSFILGIPDQLRLTAADDAKKLQFQMNVFWLKAARIVPKGGPRRDT